jgi:hypothetical protein
MLRCGFGVEGAVIAGQFLVGLDGAESDGMNGAGVIAIRGFGVVHVTRVIATEHMDEGFVIDVAESPDPALVGFGKKDQFRRGDFPVDGGIEFPEQGSGGKGEGGVDSGAMDFAGGKVGGNEKHGRKYEL